LFSNCFVFTYSTVTGRKCEINIIVIVIVTRHRLPDDMVSCMPATARYITKSLKSCIIHWYYHKHRLQ